MCGRYYISEETYQDIQRIVSQVEQNIKKKIQTRDVHPTERAPVLVWKEPGKLCLTEKTWGYPGWQKKGVIFNARAESVKEKRIFQNGISYHRAVIPVSGFYEWNHQKEKNTFYRKDKNTMYLAGFYDRFGMEDRFIILTTQANDSMKLVHDRMPLVLESSQVVPWLSEKESAGKLLQQEPVSLERYTPYEQQSLF